MRKLILVCVLFCASMAHAVAPDVTVTDEVKEKKNAKLDEINEGLAVARAKQSSDLVMLMGSGGATACGCLQMGVSIFVLWPLCITGGITSAAGAIATLAYMNAWFGDARYIESLQDEKNRVSRMAY